MKTKAVKGAVCFIFGHSWIAVKGRLFPGIMFQCSRCRKYIDANKWLGMKKKWS